MCPPWSPIFRVLRVCSAPQLAESGAAGQEMWVDLELKLVADVGIIGVPNAGKSTLLSIVSAAKPKIADYPFTTLVPNLGVCEMDFRTTVFADVPGTHLLLLQPPLALLRFAFTNQVVMLPFPNYELPFYPRLHTTHIAGKIAILMQGELSA